MGAAGTRLPLDDAAALQQAPETFGHPLHQAQIRRDRIHNYATTLSS
jgi:hypothetical protein